MPEAVSLISRWFPKPGATEAAVAALESLAADVAANEPGTLTYLVHTDFTGDARLQSLPPSDAGSILFFESYSDADAFVAHVTGPLFLGFVAAHGDLFLAANGKPYTTVNFLATRAGFVRGAGPVTNASAALPNRHPSVMFEIIAQDQAAMTAFYATVFGWRYQAGRSGFAYVHFPAGSPPLLGGIGQAEPGVPGFAPGHAFYLLVDAVQPVIDAALAAGGAALMPPTTVDGYTFAMFRDPEGNPVGLIEPFAARSNEETRA